MGRYDAHLIDPAGIEASLLAELGELEGARVLEIGSGDGRVTLRYADRARSVLAVDPDEDRIATARRSLPSRLADRVRFEARALEDLNVPPATFDTVLFSHSL